MSVRTELWNAIECGHAKTVRRSLRKHPELVEIADQYGFSPLMRAVMSSDRTVEVIDALLDAGAQVNRQSDEGYTALHCAIDVNGQANENADQVIGRLIAAGADLTLRQHYGWTPLLRAVVEGTAAEVQALLAGGADPNETMPFDTLPAFNAGRTGLMAAITNPEAEVVIKALLSAGADPMRRDAHGATFFEYAQSVELESGGSIPENVRFSEVVRRCIDLARNYTRGA